jgi:hypothetical protein
MAVCCQNLKLGALSSRSTLSVLVGALFKEFGLFLNTPRTSENYPSTSFPVFKLSVYQEGSVTKF